MIDLVVGFSLPGFSPGNWLFQPLLNVSSARVVVALRLLGFYIGLNIIWRNS